MGDLLQDLHFAARTLLKKRDYTIVAVLTLALAIGANSAIFSVVNAVLLRSPPYGDPDRLVVLWERNQGVTAAPFTPGNFSDFKADSTSFDYLAAINVFSSFTLTGGEYPIEASGVSVSTGFFEAVGVKPVLGRTFTPEEDRPGSDRVVILGYSLWQRYFGSSSDLVGNTIRVNGDLHTVVGIMPHRFAFPQANEMPSVIASGIGSDPELWVPLALNDDRSRDRSIRYLMVIGRLKEGVSVDAAQAESHTLAGRIASEFPADTGEEFDVGVVSIHEQAVREVRPALLLLLGAVGFVLLIACANVANLFLSRALERSREMATRAALGASRRRLVRQLLTESVLFGLIGGGLGLLFSVVGVKIVKTLSPGGIPHLDETSLDARVVGVTFALALMTGILFGLVPTIRASKIEGVVDLKEGTRSLGATRTQRRLQNLLVIAELALALLLIIGTGLLMKSFVRLQKVNTGFDPDQLHTMKISLPRAKYPEAYQQRAFFQDFYRRVGSLPGVESVGAIWALPLTGHRALGPFWMEGHAPTDPEEEQMASYQLLGHDGFKALGVPLLSGRLLTEQDDESTPPVVVVNAETTRRLWPDENAAIGNRLRLWEDVFGEASWEVVGVVGNIKQSTLNEEAMPQIFVPYLQFSSRSMSLLVRTSAESAALIPSIRHELRAVDPEQPLANIEPIQRILSRSVAEPRFYTLLIGSFSGIALIMAMIGIYGVVSYSVKQRINEIGIRMALGGHARSILKLVIVQGMVLCGVGVALGIGMALGLTRFLSSRLYGVTALDFGVFAGSSLLFIAVAIAAIYIPARRASQVDPVVLLRYE